MKKKFGDFFFIKEFHKREFRKQLNSFIVISLAFSIAFTWRQTFFDLSEAFVSFFITVKSNATLSILTSTFITILSIILIYLSSYWLVEKHEHHSQV